jgi:aminoglycoside 2''-adenylyltransferase
MNHLHVPLIKRIFAAAEIIGLPLWIGGGWAIDARLGRVTREHDDIDLTFPAERQTELEDIIRQLDGRITEQTEYGFLAMVQEVLLDCEPAHFNNLVYEIEDTPAGSCPMAKEGVIDQLPIRCNSWAAIVWDYFYYEDEVPRAQWPKKHAFSYALVCEALGDNTVTSLRKQFDVR